MTHLFSPLWLLFYSLCLLTLRGIWWMVISSAKHRSMSDAGRIAWSAREKTTNRLTKLAIFGVLCFVSGRWERDLEQFSNTHTLHDVRITEKKDDSNYRMTFLDRPADEFRAPLCTPRPQFFVGLQFKEFTYEDRRTCWFIEWTDNTRLGYRLYETLYKEKQNVEASAR